ncbi:hypothetical protein [Runella aurantiaca]|uniref:Glycosyltransferase n=1 Tax=Runella aurantiaca TaxID=2282308 RepID=A0A369I940_9BACT|nr:hypothetical protein [Runella aurantiaca]RDB06281.1 hypothetical protein DVG78_08430 [Runella aurantiaca]
MKINNSITFVAPFPTNQNIKDGLVSRVAAIDKIFQENHRLYLDISFTKNLKKKILKQDTVTIYYLNFFIHCLSIIKLCASSTIIYCHTLGRVARIIFPLLFLRKRYKLILDIHGTDPEQSLYNQNYVMFICLALIEKIAFKKIDLLVSVTNAMASFYKNKYPSYKKEMICYTILPSTILNQYEIQHNKIISIKDKYSITSNDIVVIYSGGIHKWQKIDETFNIISKNNYSNIKYFILTNNILETKKIIAKNNIKNVVTLSLHPSELIYFYQLAHYGFVLRDDHILNRVACPTKLMEYLSYSITPIVDLIEIGDFNTLNYNYLHKEYFNISNISPKKETRNKKIIENIISKNNKNVFYLKVMEYA